LSLIFKISKLRTEFFKKLSDSETERDNISIDFQKVVMKHFEIANKNSKGQDENWDISHERFSKLEELSEIQSQINLDNLDIFKEFDSIIQGLDEKVNTVSDSQEEILITKELDKQQLNIACRELDKLIMKKNSYEIRITEVFNLVDDLNLRFNQNVHISAGNFERTTDQFNRVQRNFDKIKDLLKKLKEIDSLNLKVIEQSHCLNEVIKGVKEQRDNVGKVADRLVKLDTNFSANDTKLNSLSKKVDQQNHSFNLAINKYNENIATQFLAKNLKKVLENPIEVTIPSCETKLKMKQQVNQNDVESITEIKNKVDFRISSFNFQRLDIFKKWDDFLYVFRKGKMEESFELRTNLAKVIWSKAIELNEPKPKRKYTKKNAEKKSINERCVMGA
jgi:hypothetical protein